MTTIEVRGLAFIGEIFGRKRFEYSFEGSLSVYELLNNLDKEYKIGDHIYNEDHSISEFVRIFLDGRDICFMNEADLNLKDGDIVLIMPRLAGG